MSNLTIDKIREAMRLIEPKPRFDTIFGGAGLFAKAAVSRESFEPFDLPSDPAAKPTIFGMRAYELAPSLTRRPVLQISPTFEHCSDEFRARWNAWALERFGTEEVCYLMDSNVLAEMVAGVQVNIDKRILRIITGLHS